MLLGTPEQARRQPPLPAEAAAQSNRQATQYLHLGGLAQPKRGRYARYITTGPTRIGTISMVGEVVVSCGGCCAVPSIGEHAGRRADTDSPVRMCSVDNRKRALRHVLNDTPQFSPTEHWYLEQASSISFAQNFFQNAKCERVETTI